MEVFVPERVAEMRAFAQSQDISGPHQFAEPIDAAISPWSHGLWESLPDGRTMWRMRISSPDAESINLGFLDYRMPPGGEMFLYASDGSRIAGPFTERHNRDHNQFWSPVVESQEVVVEVTLPEEGGDEFRLFLTSVNYGLVPLKARAGSGTSGSCNVDVACPAADPWRDQVRSVGVYTRNGSWTCTGALVNNTANDMRQLFLTANHCNVSETTAPTMVIYWNYQSSTCRTPGTSGAAGSGDATLTDFSQGATHIASSTTADFALVEINDPIDPDWNVYYAGWSRSTSIPPSVATIHHPRTDAKRISLASQVDITNYLRPESTSSGTHWRIITWDLGTTEPGSSGSPLFNAAGEIIGQLHGGYASCTNDADDWYGRFSLSWDGGGTSSSRLRDHLDPVGLDPVSWPGSGGAALTPRYSLLEIDDAPPLGDGDGVAEPGEALLITLPMENLGTEEVAAPTTVTLTASEGAGAVVPDPESVYPAAAPGELVFPSNPFAVEILPEHPCGEPVELVLLLESDGQPYTRPLTIPTGPVCDFLPRLVLDGEPFVEDGMGNGNNNGRPDPGESSIALTFPLRNSGSDLPAMELELRAVSHTVSVQPSASLRSFGASTFGQTFNNTLPYLIAVSDEHPCGEPLLFELAGDHPGLLPIPVSIPTRGDTAETVESISPGTVFGYQPEVVEEVISIDEPGNVLKVVPTFRVPHTYLGDLSLRLISPEGTEVLLFNRFGGAQQNLLETTFDDEAPLAIQDGSPPYTGSFRPVEPLAAFEGEEISGDWVFRLIDHADFDEGTVERLDLHLLYSERTCAPPLPTGLLVTDSGGKPVGPGKSSLTFGIAFKDAEPVRRTLYLTNTGEATVYLYSLELPVGFTRVGSLPPRIDPGGATSITIEMSAAEKGNLSGTAVLETSLPGGMLLPIGLTGVVVENDWTAPPGLMMY